jgi:3D (Asp-Asp-Asp) domain-containing protein
MSNPILVAVLLGSMTTTAYRSVPAQTKPKGYEWGASGERCNVHGVAVSQDLLKKNGGILEYGDLVYVEGIGYKFVNDCMNKRWKNCIDIWVEQYADEKAFDKKFRGHKLKVFKINGGSNETYHNVQNRRK